MIFSTIGFLFSLVIFLVLIVILLFLYSACVLSSRISKQEEFEEIIRKSQEKKKPQCFFFSVRLLFELSSDLLVDVSRPLISQPKIAPLFQSLVVTSAGGFYFLERFAFFGQERQMSGSPFFFLLSLRAPFFFFLSQVEPQGLLFSFLYVVNAILLPLSLVRLRLTFFIYSSLLFERYCITFHHMM